MKVMKREGGLGGTFYSRSQSEAWDGRSRFETFLCHFTWCPILSTTESKSSCFAALFSLACSFGISQFTPETMVCDKCKIYLVNYSVPWFFSFGRIDRSKRELYFNFCFLFDDAGQKKLGKVICPDPWKSGARNTTGNRRKKGKEHKEAIRSF